MEDITTYYIDSQTFPCINYFKTLFKCSYLNFNSFERFKKSSFNNRYIIAGANGLVNLTIPIAGGREQKALITEIEIDYSVDWQTKHWRTIVSAYSKSPFFDYYCNDIKKMLFNKEQKLFEFNYFILSRIFQIVGIQVDVNTNDGFDAGATQTITSSLLPKNFQENTLDWKPKYEQVFENKLGFQSNLSILDLLFCVGPNSRKLLDESLL